MTFSSPSTTGTTLVEAMADCGEAWLAQVSLVSTSDGSLEKGRHLCEAPVSTASRERGWNGREGKERSTRAPANHDHGEREGQRGCETEAWWTSVESTPDGWWAKRSSGIDVSDVRVVVDDPKVHRVIRNNFP